MKIYVSDLEWLTEVGEWAEKVNQELALGFFLQVQVSDGLYFKDDGKFYGGMSMSFSDGDSDVWESTTEKEMLSWEDDAQAAIALVEKSDPDSLDFKEDLLPLVHAVTLAYEVDGKIYLLKQWS